MYEMSLDFLFLMYYSFDYYYIKIQKIKYLQYHKSYGIYMIRILLNKDMHVLVLHSCTSVISRYEKWCNIRNSYFSKFHGKEGLSWFGYFCISFEKNYLDCAMKNLRLLTFLEDCLLCKRIIVSTSKSYY